MMSKHAKKISSPCWFIENLPKDILLDGELWLGRETFEQMNGVLNSIQNSPLWDKIRYLVFDSPSSKESYKKRIDMLTKLNLPKHISIVDVKECKGNDHLQDCLKEVLTMGGEGLMANKPDALYVPTRTDVLLKVKVLKKIFFI